eukprot:3949341-Pyramimonas_sp.AAC.1
MGEWDLGRPRGPGCAFLGIRKRTPPGNKLEGSNPHVGLPYCVAAGTKLTCTPWRLIRAKLSLSPPPHTHTRTCREADSD